MQEQESSNNFINESSQYFLQQNILSCETSQTENQIVDTPLIIQSNIFSSHKAKYQNYFVDVEQEVEHIIKNNLKDNKARIKHKLVLLNENQMMHDLISFKRPVNYIIGNLYGGAIIKYEVVVGNYKLSLDLLNLNFKAPKDLIEIGKGGYGMIFKFSIDGQTTFAVKRINFHQKYKLQIDDNEFIKPTKLEINEVICEYAIYKICSFYKIGPKIINFGFDLVCFENCIQFYIEYCNRIVLIYPSLKKQLKIAVRLLHRLKIIHKDIKPSNLLYSHANDKLVLCDFGISHPVEQSQNQLTKTYKQGSPRFMSQQMANIKIGQEDYIDLYYNDLHGLEVSLNELNQFYEKNQKKISFKQKNIQCKINIIYAAINLFYQLVNNNVSLVMKLMNKLHNMIKDIHEFFKQILNQQIKNMIDLNQEIKDRFITILSIDTKQWEEKQKVFYLIRCYGLTEMLYDQLSLLPKTDFITKILNKINMHAKSSNDLTPWYHLQRLTKITPLKMKIERKIKILQDSPDNNSIKQDSLLNLYFDLFYINLQKQHYIDKYCIQLKNKIVKAYKVRPVDDRYKLLNLVVNIINNKNNFKFYEKAILQFIAKYPQCQQLILKKVIRFCKKQYAIPYYLKLLEFYKRKNQVDYLKICQLLDLIVQNYSQNKQSQIFKLYLCQLEQTVQLIKNKYTQQVQIKIYVWLGNIETLKNNYHKAIYQHYKECQKKQKIYYGQSSLNRAIILFNIGQRYFRLQEYENSIAYIKQSLQIYKLYSHQIQQDKKISNCYSYLCIIYYINKNDDLFKKYLDLSSCNFMIKNKKCLSNDVATELKQEMQKVIDEIITIQKNNTKITIQKYNRYCEIFKIGLQIYIKKLTIIKFISVKDQSSLKSLLNRFIDIEFKQYMSQLLQFIVIYFLVNKIDSISYLHHCLKFEQISKDFQLKDNILQELYGLISYQYRRIKQNQLSYAYLKKYLRKMLVTNIFHSLQLIYQLIRLSFAMKRYHQCIYFFKRILKKVKTSLYILILECYFYLHQYKTAKKYFIEYLKQYIPWQISSYQILMKLYFKSKSRDNFMIIRCYLCELFNDKINSTNYPKITKNMTYAYHVCKIVFTDGQTNNEQQSLKTIKISKRILSIKLKIGCLKYIKSKHLKKKIKNRIKQLN